MMEDEIRQIYGEIKEVIRSRLKEFREIGSLKEDRRIFEELTFCLLTPQSKAKMCWIAVSNLISSGALFRGEEEDIERELRGVRFKRNKARYIKEARAKYFKDGKFSIKDRIFSGGDPHKEREWLVKNVRGLGYKEASHFLRNIGLGENLAILDRHILKNLKLLGVIEDIPTSLNRKRYLQIEERMREFSKKIGVPLEKLDLVLWYKETGEVFK